MNLKEYIMKKKQLFNHEELATLPFNYQYLGITEGLLTKKEQENTFRSYREITINALNTTKHFTPNPQKIISKIYHPIIKK